MSLPLAYTPEKKEEQTQKNNTINAPFSCSIIIDSILTPLLPDCQFAQLMMASVEFGDVYSFFLSFFV
jgi:hypothetical protein